jgi:ribosome-interacting GTPase 1
MPANLTPEYIKAEEEFRKASTPDERLTALQRMLAVIPKHKGTEKMRADLKKKIAATRGEIQKATKRKGFSIRVEREGAGQVILVGPPNAGKTQLAGRLSNTELEVAAYPFTTRMPQPAMMSYEDIQIQLVDLPPVSRQHMDHWMPSIIRTGDLILIVVDLSDDSVLDQIDESLRLLPEMKIEAVNFKPIEDSWESIVKKRVIIVGCKLDLKDARENLKIVKELFNKTHLCIGVSAVTGESLAELATSIFNALELVRVYSKQPGKKVETSQPFVLHRGSNLEDFAAKVHKDFLEKLKFARLWGHGKFEGQRINRDYLLQDKDIIELHI